MKPVTLCICLLFALNVLGQTPPASARPPAAGRDETRRFALLIGIDHYRSPTIPRLHGAKNDVMVMRSVLIGRYHFPERNVHLLIDEQATYARILDEFKSFLMANVKGKEDIVVVHFSGHGSRFPEPSSPSGFDETIVPYDSRDRRNLDITSKALSSMLRVLAQKTKNITVILDSCNSGHLVRTRGMGQVRSIPAAHSVPPSPPFPVDTSRRAGPDQPQLTPLDDSYVLLAASLAREEAKEYLVGGTRYGAFSYFLTRELQRAKSDATYLEVMEPVKEQVTTRLENQTPQLLGPNQNHVVLGTGIKEIYSYLLVEPSETEKGRVTLPYAGAPHGVTLGSTYDVYSNDVDKFEPPAQPVALIEIDRVGPAFSEAKIVSGGPITSHARAVLRDFKLTDRKLGVWVQSKPPSKALESIASRMRSLSQVELTQDADANILILEQADHVTLSTAEGTQLSMALSSSDPEIDRKVEDQILKWANWFYMLAVDSNASNLDVVLSIAPQDAQPTSRDAKSLPKIGQNDNLFYVGDKVTITVSNKSPRALYVTVLVLSSDRTISVLLPEAGEKGAAVELQPGASTSLNDVTAFVPECLTATKDTFKVIATSNPIDLRPFEQPKGVCENLRGRGDLRGDLDDLLRVPNLITRGWVTGEPGAWTTARKVVEVRKREPPKEP